VNITHVAPYMHPDAGGPPVVVDRLCRRLAARGHRVRVITTDALAGGATGWESLYADGGYDLEVHRSSGRGPFAYSRTLATAVRRAAAESDLVHLHTLWTYPTLRAAWACRKAGTPYLVMPHGMLDPNSVRRKRVKKWLYAKLVEAPNLRHAARLVYTHPEEERLARQSVPGLPDGQIVPLAADEPPTTDRDRLAGEFFAQHPDLAGGPVVLFLGRLHPKKGLDLLVPAFAEVVRSVPEARLVLVGPGDAGYVAKLKAVIAAANITERVAFLGPLAGREKWAALATARVFALTSYQENFAITAVEAMSIGTPVMLSHRVNIWPDVKSANAGIISELDTTLIAGNLLKVLSDAGFANRLGINGRTLVRQTYSWDQTADAAEIAYRDVLTPRPPARASSSSSTSGGPGRVPN
jgi:glycosyltransferase involved in cell wall biosynthesis